MTTYDFSRNRRRLAFELSQNYAEKRNAQRYLREGALSRIVRLDEQRRSLRMLMLDKP